MDAKPPTRIAYAEELEELMLVSVPVAEASWAEAVKCLKSQCVELFREEELEHFKNVLDSVTELSLRSQNQDIDLNECGILSLSIRSPLESTVWGAKIQPRKIIKPAVAKGWLSADLTMEVGAVTFGRALVWSALFFKSKRWLLKGLAIAQIVMTYAAFIARLLLAQGILLTPLVLELSNCAHEIMRNIILNELKDSVAQGFYTAFLVLVCITLLVAMFRTRFRNDHPSHVKLHIFLCALDFAGNFVCFFFIILS